MHGSRAGAGLVSALLELASVSIKGTHVGCDAADAHLWATADRAMTSDLLAQLGVLEQSAGRDRDLGVPVQAHTEMAVWTTKKSEWRQR